MPDITEDDADFALGDRDAIGGNQGPDLSEFEGTEVNPLESLNPTAQGKLKSFVERLERLDEEKATLAQDRKEVVAEAKGEGFDTKILNAVIRIRRMDKAKKAEEDALVELYLAALEEFVSG